MVLLAVGTALSLAAVDVVTVSRRRIRRIYLLDAAANLGLVAAWPFGHRVDEILAQAGFFGTVARSGCRTQI